LPTSTNIKPITFSQLPSATRLAALAMAGLSLFLIWDQYYWWKIKDEYAFGFIVPLFVGYLLYERWPAIARGWIACPAPEQVPAGEAPSTAILAAVLQAVAIFMVLGGMFCFFIGGLYRAMEGQNLISSNALAFGYGNILLGGAYLYSDRRSDGTVIPLRERWNLVMLFLFPAASWMLSVPMFTARHATISTFLMNKVAVVVYYIFDVLGYAVVREGSVLRLPLGDVGVEDACSGIRSLTACLFAGSFLGAVFFRQFWKKVLLVATAMLFAFINNVFRSLFLTAWAYFHGPEGLEDHVVMFGLDLGNVHDFTGWFVLGLTVICLLLLVKVFTIQLEYTLPEEEIDESTVTNE